MRKRTHKKEEKCHNLYVECIPNVNYVVRAMHLVTPIRSITFEMDQQKQKSVDAS